MRFQDNDVHETMFSDPKEWPVDIRIAAVVVLCMGTVLAAAFFFVRLIGN